MRVRRIVAFYAVVIVKQPSSDNTPYEKIDDEVHPLDTPFDIPESWEWVRHNDLFEISGGSQPPKSKFISEARDGYIRLYQIRDYGKIAPRKPYVRTNAFAALLNLI